MPQLRESTKKSILATLERSRFTSGAFSVRYADVDREFLVITFLPNKSFKFAASLGFGGSLSTSEAPGEHILGSQTFKRDSISDCIEAIDGWVGRILEDYRAHNPLIDEFEGLRESLREQIEAHVSDENAHFSADEVVAMKEKLDNLAAKLAEVSERTAEQEKQLREAQAAIDGLKVDLTQFPKGVWFRMAGNKVVNIIKRAATSKEGREFALEAAKTILLGGPK